jgi:paraquat-inducible protein A
LGAAGRYCKERIVPSAKDSDIEGDNMTARSLLACHECDYLQRETMLPRGGVARCRRCGAQLYRDRPDGLNRSLAYILGALVLFVISNTFPVVGLEVRGEMIQTTLLGAVHGIYADGMWPVAVLVLMTTIIAPLVEMAAIAYLLVPLHFGRIPRRHALVFRALHLARPWGMVEVLMLGVLVALAKLAHTAAVVPGIALWSLGGEMLLLAAAAAALAPRDVWAKVSAAR